MKRLILFLLLAVSAQAADVTIDGTINSSMGRNYRSVVFTSTTTGYAFQTDGDTTFGYRKTTDSGATWAAAVQISAATAQIAADVWYDQWTTGDTGTKIHCFFLNDSTDDDVHYRSLDTASDTLGTDITISTRTSATAGASTSVAGTKAESGQLYCAFNIDGGTEFGFQKSTDAGATWSADLGGSFNEGSTDHYWLFPAHGTGDTNDIWAIYQDNSATAVTMKMWDSSAVAQVESSTVTAINSQGTDLTIYQYPISGAIRQSDGHLIFVVWNERDSATGDLLAYDVSAVNSGSQTGITALTNVLTNIDDSYNPQVFVQSTGKIYIAYNGKNDGSETLGTTTKAYYMTSTDSGTTWLTESAYMEGAAAALTQVWTPLNGSRFFACWRVTGAGTFIGNSVNSVDTTPAVTTNSAFLPFLMP